MPLNNLLLSVALSALLLAAGLSASSLQTPGEVSCTGSTTSCCPGVSVDIDLDYPTLDVTIHEPGPCGGIVNFSGTVANRDCIATPSKVICSCEPYSEKFLNIQPTKDWADLEYCIHMPIRCGTCP